MSMTIKKPSKLFGRKRSGAPQAAPKLTFRPDIEGLRAVAVMLVVADHLDIPGFKGGFLGVDVFFVISGFLITSLLAEEFGRNQSDKSSGSVSISAFYARRARRILPAAMLVIAAVLIASKIVFNPIRMASVESSALWATLFLANFDLMRSATDYFAQASAVSPLQNYWSLAVEEQFYIVWPVLLVLAGRFGWNRVRDNSHDWRSQATLAIAGLTLASLAWSIHATGANPASAYFSPFTRAYELGIGATVAMVVPQLSGRLNSASATALGLIGAALIGLGMVVLGPSSAYPGYLALIPTLAAAALIIAGLGSGHRNPVGSGLATPPVRFLGRISYSIYLWHWPIIVFAAAISPGLTGAARVGVLLPMILLVSWACYLLVEQPFRKTRWSIDDLRTAVEGTSDRRTRLKLAAMAISTVLVVGTVALLARPKHELPASAASGVVSEWSSWQPGYQASSTPGSGTATPGSTADSTASTPAPTAVSPDVPDAKRIAALRAGLAVTKANSAELALIKRAPTLAPDAACFDIRTAADVTKCETEGTNANPPKGLKIANGRAVLIGNSFGAQWRSTLARALPKGTKLDSLTLVECIPFDEEGAIVKRNSHGDKCAAHAQWVVNQVKRLKPGLAVVSTNDWSFSTGLISKYVQRLRKLGVKVLWIGSTPTTPGWDTCLGSSGEIRECSQVKGGKIDFNSAGWPSAVSYSGGSWWDVMRLFCLPAGCPALLNGYPVRTDGKHMTEKVMLDVSGQLSQAIARAEKTEAARR